jgi:hypothetical protein
MGSKSEGGMKQNLAVSKTSLPPSPYGSPPVYLPFSAVQAPLEQNPSLFSSSAGFCWSWFPFAPVVDAGWNQALHAVVPVVPSPYSEIINFQMPPNVQDMIIPFGVEKVSPVILLSGPMIINVVDASPLTGLGFTVLNVSTSLLVIQLNALLPVPELPSHGPEGNPLSNYWFRALATVVG